MINYDEGEAVEAGGMPERSVNYVGVKLCFTKYFNVNQIEGVVVRMS